MALVLVDVCTFCIQGNGSGLEIHENLATIGLWVFRLATVRPGRQSNLCLDVFCRSPAANVRHGHTLKLYIDSRASSISFIFFTAIYLRFLVLARSSSPKAWANGSWGPLAAAMCVACTGITVRTASMIVLFRDC
jgi:hypothetical protein